MNKPYSKWNSRRWRISVWAMLVITLTMSFSLIFKYDPSWIGVSLPLLLSIPLAYIGAESYTKVRLQDKEQEEGK
jgi:hypothetical protein